MEEKTFKNIDGKIVAKLYIKEDGNLHPDSWLSSNGWPPKAIDETEEKRFVDRYQTMQLQKDEWELTNETDDIWLFDNKNK